MTVLHVAGHILTMAWRAFLVACHVVVACWVIVCGLVVLLVIKSVIDEHRQKRRDRRARLAAQLRDHAERGSCTGCADAPRRVREVIGDWDAAMVAELLGGNA